MISVDELPLAISSRLRPFGVHDRCVGSPFEKKANAFRLIPINGRCKWCLPTVLAAAIRVVDIAECDFKLFWGLLQDRVDAYCIAAGDGVKNVDIACRQEIDDGLVATVVQCPLKRRRVMVFIANSF